jgi:predicted DNA-binding WGR domain protein
MQLIHRKTLAYQAGSSDKVYEVDLCQLAADRYVVNYRFGRRGGTLKEGCQTPSALDLAGAQKAFDKLVNSKLAKGYQDTGAVVVEKPKPIAPAFAPDLAGRDRYILDRLAAAVANPGQADLPKQWPLDRVIWRSGELQLVAAVPLLMQLWSNQPIRNTVLPGHWVIVAMSRPSLYSNVRIEIGTMPIESGGLVWRQSSNSMRLNAPNFAPN